MRAARRRGTFTRYLIPEAPVRSRCRWLQTGVAVAALLLVAGPADAHDLFLRLERWRVAPGATVTIRLMNGAFKVNEAPVEGSRVRDLSIVSPAGRLKQDTTGWGYRADSSTTFPVRTGRPGTYVIGVSLAAKDLVMKSPRDFMKYIRDEGLDAIVAARTAAKLTNTPAKERYEKHVKLLLQVGDSVQGAISTPLGYPAEIVPLDNPYAAEHATGRRIAPGRATSIRVRAMVDGAPAPGEALFVGGITPDGARIPVRRINTDAKGEAMIPLSGRGSRWIKFIHMAAAPTEGVDYHSKWATLTFGWQ